MKTIVIIFFASILTISITIGIPIIYALLASYILFCLYGRYCGYSLRELAMMSTSGIRTIKNMLLLFLMIGMMTALWRASGTIPVIVCYAASCITPVLFLLLTFIFNCCISLLTGTSFGTAATMGVICMTLSNAMQLNPLFTGGAVLSGIYFGDRCSPVSTSALLVAELTSTSIFDNIRLMLKTTPLAFIATSLIYLGLGLAFTPPAAAIMDIQTVFSSQFHLSWILLLPAAIILALSCMRINIKAAMLSSIIAAGLLSIFYQGCSLTQLVHMLLTGYSSPSPQIAAMLNGGGIISMLKVTAIVCLSSAYAGIFAKTKLLEPLEHLMELLKQHTSTYISILATATISAMISCNQTLAIMLTQQISQHLEPGKQTLAIDIENSAVVIPALIPWTIASAVPIASIGAPECCVLMACYLYFLPLEQILNHKSF